MKKLAIIILSTLCQLQIVNAQTLSPTVFTNQGNYSTGPGVSLSSSMGETFTATLHNGNTTLTQGQQQAEVDLLTGAITPGNYCVGSTVMIPFSAKGYYGAANVFTAQLSDATGSFSAPVTIGSLTGTLSGAINAVIPVNTPSGIGYRIRVVSNLPVVTGRDNGADIMLHALPIPTITPAGFACEYSTGHVYSTESGMTAYQWTVTGGSITAGGGNLDTTVTVQWGAAGTGHVMANYVNGNGCTAAVQTNQSISINTGTSENTSVIACDNYSWSANNVNYPTSGIYSATATNAAGCIHTSTLHLTLNSSTSGNTSATVCNSYSWNSTTYTATGTYTRTFANAANCDSVHTLNLTIHTATSSSAIVNQSGCYTWIANGATYTVSGLYTATLVNSVNCDSITQLNLTITPGVSVSMKAMLSGAYVPGLGLMHDSLRVRNLIPLTEPYSAMPYGKLSIGGPAGETMAASILEVSGQDAIVDWVFLELRSSASPSTVVANKRALIQRDGDIVSADGVSPVFFPTVYNGTYFVSLKHRNHLGVMSANALSFGGCSVTTVDLSTELPVYTNPLIGNAPRKLIGSVYTLWSGDANNNKNVKYNGLSNDKDKVLSVIGIAIPNNTLQPVYRMEDLNMDGMVRYNNTDNDRIIILDNVGVNSPNTILNQHTPN